MPNKDQEFSYSKIFLSPFEYSYFKKPNGLKGQINYLKLISENKNNLINKNQLSCGVEYCQRKQKKGFFVQNVIYFFKPLEIVLTYKYSKCENDIKRKSTIFSNKLSFIYNFCKRQIDKLEKEMFPFEPISHLNFQIMNKTINNNPENLGTSAIPNDIITNLPDEDSQFIAKISYENNKLPPNTMNNSFLKISLSLIKSLNSFYMNNKIFMRKIIPLTSYLISQFNFEGGLLINLLKGQSNSALKVHEKLYVHNFKGIINPSKKIGIPSTNNNKQNYEYMLGNTSYSLFSSKFLFKHCPLLYFNSFNLYKDGFEILPFTHFSSLITNGKESLRLSAGLGISVISKLFTFEILCMPYVKKELSDIHSIFHLKFGLD